MPRDPLAVLWRIRDAAVAKASRELAEARSGERDQVARLEAQLAGVRREEAGVTTDLLPEFIAWLPHARRASARLQADVKAARAKVDSCQRALTVHQTNAETVARAMARRTEQERHAQVRKDQAAMDEIASRRLILPDCRPER